MRRFEITNDQPGEYRLRLKGHQGETIAVSAAHSTKASAVDEIRFVHRYAPEAEVVDLTV